MTRPSPPARNLRQEQCQALILALKRFGYTNFRSSFDGYREIIYPADLKPCYVYIDYEALVVLHRTCTDCYRYDLPHHESDFLKAMIPIIGLLDAHAEFDACEGRGWSPRLWIRLG